MSRSLAGLTDRTILLQRSFARRLIASRLLLGLLLGGFVLGGLTLGALRPIPALADSYHVQPGDTLSSIAERYGTTQGVLRALNPAIDSADLLYIGQEIDLPDNALLAPTTADATMHVVQPGETLSGIAALHQVSISNLLALNPGQTPDLLFSGVELIIRGAGISSTTTTPVEITPPIDTSVDPPSNADSPQIAGVPVTLYRVQAGDTFTGLALRFNTSVETLIVFNLNIRPDGLFIDSLLWVPAAGGSIPPFTARPSFSGDAPTSI
ncbi:MAG: LysM peptidoglycan-binding domain-containing protein, partial [Chloroflexi bacterium]|nr:LysM peptidoglycan-binding domain-containing protein [Chloroflexota bacterium]